NRRCVSVREALQDKDFVSVLSRFEHDWLTRLPATTLIGPAYDSNGRILSHSFAVWRKEAHLETTNKRVLVAGSRH
ncbi:MAG TPA: hypothetical protein V6D17_19965, partial [Candidatus Obscuribacterales bacterium]